ncbi:MAG: beta-lactamase family protein [Clostridia bacterium]|nr:beta-lactamase family protein [Clostridia bacterium]
MDKKALIENLVRDAHARGGFTGAWLYAENGEIVSKGAAGPRDPGGTLPLTEDCVFDLASVSKQFTASAVMLLNRQGLLGLDDKITRFFPEIPYKCVTIRHLLNHTGGLPDYMAWLDKTAKKEHTIPGNDAIVRFLCECGEEPLFAPGEKWEYSNTGYCLLAQIVEKAAGVKFEDFLRDNIFVPAGMASTRVYHRRKDALTVDGLAYGMVLRPGSGRYLLPDDDPIFSEAVTCDGVNGDGLVHSSVTDLYRWDRALRAGKVLTKAEQLAMYTPGRLNSGAVSGDPSDEDGDAYGFGWFVKTDPLLGLTVCHSGGWYGYDTWFERFLDADRVLIWLRCRESLDERVSEAFKRGMEAIARDEVPGPVRAIEELALKDPDRHLWESFAGRYDYSAGEFRISEVFPKGADLYAKASYKDSCCEIRLYPLAENTFGAKDLDGDIVFGDGCLTLWDKTAKKL